MSVNRIFPTAQEEFSYSRRLLDSPYNRRQMKRRRHPAAPVSPEEARNNFIDAVGRKKRTLAELSRKIGRANAYLHQYVNKGSPRYLDERDRRVLAAELGVSEIDLGAPPDLPPSDAAIGQVSTASLAAVIVALASDEAGDLTDGQFQKAVARARIIAKQNNAVVGEPAMTDAERLNQVRTSLARAVEDIAPSRAASPDWPDRRDRALDALPLLLLALEPRTG